MAIIQKRYTLDQWIREALTDPDKEAKCSAMSLIHIVNGVGEREIHTVKLGDKKWDPKDLAKLFRGKAEGYAAELTGQQAFNLCAFYGNSDEVGARKPFMIHGQADFGPEGATEPPTKEGQTSQAMRHTEAIIQMCFRQQAMMFETMGRTIEMLSNQNAKLMAENQDAMSIVKEVTLAQADARHKHRMEQIAEYNRGRERQKWLAFGPALVNTVLGREIFPQSVADTALIESIAESLSEEDIMKLAQSGIVKPHLLGPFAARVGDLLKRKRLAEQEAEQIMSEVQSDESEDFETGAIQTAAAE